MLHQDMLYRFHREQPVMDEPLLPEPQAPGQDTIRQHRWMLIASITGNVLVGGALIGTLLLTPAWLASLIFWI